MHKDHMMGWPPALLAIDAPSEAKPAQRTKVPAPVPESMQAAARDLDRVKTQQLEVERLAKLRRDNPIVERVPTTRDGLPLGTPIPPSEPFKKPKELTEQEELRDYWLLPEIVHRILPPDVWRHARWTRVPPRHTGWYFANACSDPDALEPVTNRFRFIRFYNSQYNLWSRSVRVDTMPGLRRRMEEAAMRMSLTFPVLSSGSCKIMWSMPVDGRNVIREQELLCSVRR